MDKEDDLPPLAPQTGTNGGLSRKAPLNDREPFRDPDLPLEDRLDDLIRRLTRDEKVALLHQHQPAVRRLGLAPFHTGREALHGVAWLGPATVFPQAVGLASTWDPELVRRVGSAVGDEVRGFQYRNPSTGLNVWAPVVNLLVDPRWGRNEEGYSEDPLLTGAISTAYAAGLRGDDPVHLKTAPTLKHFLAYNCEAERDTMSASVRPRVLWEYELEAFRPALAAGVATGIMLSYNLVNGRPAHLSVLVNDVVRTWSRDPLLVVSDAFAPSNIAGSQRYYPDHAEAHAAALRAGLDSFTDQADDPTLTVTSIRAALERGLLTEADVETAVRRSLAIRFRLGEFDPPRRVRYSRITDAVIGAPEHRALAREAGRRAIVLLKNDRQMLPLRAKHLRRIAVLGPLADQLFEDWYSGTLPYEVTPAVGIAEGLGRHGGVVCREGVDRIALRVQDGTGYVTAPCAPSGGALLANAAEPGPAQAFDVFDWGEGVCTLRAVANGRYLALGGGDVVLNESVQPRGWVVKELFRMLPVEDGAIVVQNVANARYVAVSPVDGGLAATADSPTGATRFVPEVLRCGLDAAATAARGADVAIVVVGNAPCINGRETQDRRDIGLAPQQERLVRRVAAANPRTILLVESSYPMAITWADAHVPAILWSSHGGQEMGHALADVLFGDYPPAGRLTQTWYRSTDELGDIRDYDIIKSRKTYLYFDGTPLYPFGHGLTYATFTYGNLRVSPEGDVSLEVTNEGPMASDEVVQLYTRKLESRVEQPRRRLRGFQRVHLQPGETRVVRFALQVADLAIWDVSQGRFVVEAGTYEVLAGRSSADLRLTARLDVEGETIPPRRLYGVETSAATFDDDECMRLVDETRVRGDAVAPAGDRGWIAFREADFGTGASQFTARVSRPSPGEAVIQLRLDDPVTGLVAGETRVPCTGDRYQWMTVTSEVRNAAGVHDLYIVLTGAMNLAGFRFD